MSKFDLCVPASRQPTSLWCALWTPIAISSQTWSVIYTACCVFIRCNVECLGAKSCSYLKGQNTLFEQSCTSYACTVRVFQAYSSAMVMYYLLSCVPCGHEKFLIYVFFSDYLCKDECGQANTKHIVCICIANGFI